MVLATIVAILLTTGPAPRPFTNCLYKHAWVKQIKIKAPHTPQVQASADVLFLAVYDRFISSRFFKKNSMTV